MIDRNVLVLWTEYKKKNVIPEKMFVKSFKENGKAIPLFEGAHRMVKIGQKQHEAKILRISSSRKYLQSLLVTKEGEVLLHGSKPPSKDQLAKNSDLIDDEPEEKKKEREAMRVLNANAEEQPPNIVLDGYEECNHGCFHCCGTLPQFPTLPVGFVKTLLSLAEYFQHFHKSTAANIMAITGALADMSAELATWQRASQNKIELKKESGVWIEPEVLQKIVNQAESNTKRTPHQNILKNLLTHLLGIETYLNLSAEKMDRRLLSAVAGFVNEKYPQFAQPVERYYRSINLNRGYLLKRKLDPPIVNPNRLPRKTTVGSFPGSMEDPKVKRPKMAMNQDAAAMKTHSNFSGQSQINSPRNFDNSVTIPVVPPVLSGNIRNMPVRPGTNVTGNQIVPVISNSIQSFNNLGRPMVASTSNLLRARIHSSNNIGQSMGPYTNIVEQHVMPSTNNVVRPVHSNTTFVGQAVISSANNVAPNLNISRQPVIYSSSGFGQTIISSTNNTGRPLIGSTNNMGRSMIANANNLGLSTNNFECTVTSANTQGQGIEDFPVVSCRLPSGDNVNIPIVPSSMLNDKSIGVPIVTNSVPSSNITSAQVFYLHQSDERENFERSDAIQPILRNHFSSAFSGQTKQTFGHLQNILSQSNTVPKFSSLVNNKASLQPGSHSTSTKPQTIVPTARSSNMILINSDNLQRGKVPLNYPSVVSSSSRVMNVQNSAVNLNSLSSVSSMSQHGSFRLMSPTTNPTIQAKRAPPHATKGKVKEKTETIDLSLSP